MSVPVENVGHLGAAISGRRRHRDLSREDVAQQIGVSASHLKAIEKGAVVPDLDTLTAIARVMDLKVWWLLRDASI